MRALLVQCYPGSNAAVSRHYPYWQKAGFDRIIGLTTEGGGCYWPTKDTAVCGPNSYVKGDHLPKRLAQSLEIGIATGASEVCVIEYDTIFFKPLPRLTQQGVAMVRTGGPLPGRFLATTFYHNPWFMQLAAAIQLAKACRETIAKGDIEEGQPDWFLGLVVERYGIPVLENVFTRYTQNTIHTPEHLEQAREARRNGVDAMHGIKTKEVLDYIMS